MIDFNWFLTLSFWLAVLSIGLLPWQGNRRIHLTITMSLLFVGVGGVGTSWGYFVGLNGSQVRPLKTVQLFLNDGAAIGRTLVFVGVIAHGVFGLWGLWRVYRYWVASNAK